MIQPRKKKLLAITIDESAREILGGVADRLGRELLSAADYQTMKTRDDDSPDMVFLGISGQEKEDRQAIDAIRTNLPLCPIVGLGEASVIRQAMAQYGDLIADFIVLPAREISVELAIRRVVESAGLKKRITDLEDASALSFGRGVEHLLESERFIIVKQMVDKLSSFIARIAEDVEDGVKYFHSTPYFVSIHNCDLKVIATDTTYQRYFGGRIGKNSWDIYLDDAGDPDNCPVGITVKTAKVQRMKAVVRYAGGTKAPVIVHTAPIYNNNGKMTMVLEVAAGSREIKSLRKDLRTTQQKYQKIFDGVPDYIAVLNREFRVTAVNRVFEETFGKQIGVNFFDIFHKKGFVEAECPLIKTLKDGLAHSIETELTAINGSKFKTILSTAPIKTVAGKIIQVIVIFKDITQLRQLEDNLSTLGLMFSVVSHNIKGVLTGLDAGLYLIDHGFYKNQPGRIEEGLEVANLMVERIRKLILDVLYYAKPRALQVQIVDIWDLATEIVQHIRPKMAARDISFEHNADSASGEFEADREIFRSIMVNLLDNAMEACMDPNSDRKFHISFTVTETDDGVSFKVTDNGTGMDDRARDKIFSKFYSTKGKKGTGLGLFIANQVVSQHGGKITVDSEPDAGTAFTIIMPKKIPAAILKKLKDLEKEDR